MCFFLFSATILVLSIKWLQLHYWLPRIASRAVSVDAGVVKLAPAVSEITALATSGGRLITHARHLAVGVCYLIVGVAVVGTITFAVYTPHRSFVFSADKTAGCASLPPSVVGLIVE